MTNTFRAIVLGVAIFQCGEVSADDNAPIGTDWGAGSKPVAADALFVSSLSLTSRESLLVDSRNTRTFDFYHRKTLEAEFQSTDVIQRFGKYKRLSLLTFVKIGRSRLFLGISDEGIAGLHFNIVPKSGNDQTLELATMPYLSTTDIPGSK